MEAALIESAAPVAEQTVAQEIDAANKETQDAVQVEGSEATEEVTEQKEQPKEEVIPKGVQKRIDRAVRQKYEAEARANELERRIRELESKTAPRQVEGEPRIEQFDNIEEYVAAKAAFVADQRINHTLTTRERAAAEQRAQAAQQQSAENWSKRVILATAEMPDFEEVVEASDISFRDPVVLEAIKESDIGPKIAYYLAMNPDEAATIASMTGMSAIRAIGRIEAKIQDGKATVTRTPPPIEPAGAKAKAIKSPEDMSDTEFATWRKKHISQR